MNNTINIHNLAAFKKSAEVLTKGLFQSIDEAKSKLSPEELEQYENAKKESEKSFNKVDELLKKFKL